jgi:hypothetical protein
MAWFTDIIKVLPAIKSKFQLTGLIVGIAAFVAVRVAAPDAIVAQVCAGTIGVLFLIFGQIFQAIPHFPEHDRVKLVLTLFITFLLFILCLVGIIVYSLNGAKKYKGTEVSIGISGPISFEDEMRKISDNPKFNVSIFFNKKTCDDTVMKAMIQPNTTDGDDMKDYLTKLRSRIQKTQGGLPDYSVKQEGPSYEIVCNRPDSP